MNINGPKIYFTIPIFGGIAVTQTLITSFVATVLICVAAILLGRGLKKRPGKRQVLTEKAVGVITNLVSEAMGEHNVRWTPFIAAIFFSSILGTLLGMTGILKSSTADLSTTVTWAVVISAICWYQSIKNNGFLAWLKGFTEPIAIMTPMNIVSEIAQPVSLAFRHFGNIAGGSVITALIYWALSGASLGLLRLIGSSSIAVSLALLAVGIVLLFVWKPKKGKLLLRILGAVSAALSFLCLFDRLWRRCGIGYPQLSTGVYAAILILAFLVFLAGLVMLLWRKKPFFLPAGIACFVVGLLTIIVISGGPLEAPILSVGLPGVLSLYFDVFSGVIQAFVFSLLSMIYISGACPPPEETGKQ